MIARFYLLRYYTINAINTHEGREGGNQSSSLPVFFLFRLTKYSIELAKSNESNTCKEDTKRIITVDNKSHIKQKS